VSQARIAAALRPVVQTFERLQVPYAIGGSLASSQHGFGRSTLDADIMADLRLTHVPPLIAALGDEYYADLDVIAEAVQQRTSFNVIHLATMAKVDIFLPKGTPFDRSELARVRTGSFGEGPDAYEARVASPEDIVLRKLAWYRASNEVLDRQWIDILSVLEVQAQTIDIRYMRRWAPALGVADLLERALQQAGLT
jgi:hypothetical protein